MTEEEIEKVAGAILEEAGGRSGLEYADLNDLARAAITALDQHREGKGREPEEEPSGPLGMRFTPLG